MKRSKISSAIYLIWIVGLFLLDCFHVAYAQELTPKFSHVTVNEGLSQGNVTCMMQDSQGFMWFGSWDGLNRFDGFNVKVFRERLKDPNSIRGSLINSLLEISSKEIAVATSHSLNILNRDSEKFVSYNINGKPNDTKIIHLEKQVLVLCINNELWNFDLKKKQFVKEKSYKSILWNNYFGKNKIAVNHGASLYPALYDAILIDTSLFKLFEQVHESHLLNDILYHQATYYLATDDGLFSIKAKQVFQLTREIKVKCLAKSSSKLFAGTQDEGIHVIGFDQKISNQRWQYDERNSQSLTGNFVRTLLVSKEEVLWVSCLGSGVNFTDLKGKVARTLFSKNDPKLLVKQDKYIKNLCEDKDSMLWVNTVTGNIYLLNNAYDVIKIIKPEQIDAKRKPTSIQQLFQTRNHTIYLLTDQGLYKQESGFSFTHIEAKDYAYNQSYFIHMSALTDSTYLLGSRQGVSILDARGSLHKDDEFDTSNVILSTYKDHRGRVYVNSMFAGLQIYEKFAQAYKKYKQIPLGFNTKHFVEIQDTLWIATSLGLLKLNTKDFTYHIFDESDGLPSQCIYCLIPDQLLSHTFWCSSNKGVFRFNTQTRQVLPFGLEDGLSSVEFNTNAFIHRKNGDMVFGSIDGFSVFNLAQGIDLEREPPILLREMMVGGVLAIPVNQQGKLIYQIPYQNNGFTARLLKLKYPNYGSIISYRLKGYDKQVVESTYPVDLRYTSLPIGEYEMEVNILNPRGGSAWVSLASIQVMAPLYLSIWAFLCYSLVIIAIGWWIYNLYRLKNEQEKRAIHQSAEMILKERDRISADLHDDIGSTLSSILIYNDLILANSQSKPASISSLAEKVSYQVKELMTRTEDIIWSMKIREGQIETIAKRVNEYAGDLFAVQSIKYQISIDQEIESIIQKPADRRNILMIIKEAMNNCRKYSEAKLVTIRMIMVHKEIILTIDDNGKGFDQHFVNYGDGIHNIENRCVALSGYAKIHSQLGKGTNIECRFPIAIFSHYS